MRAPQQIRVIHAVLLLSGILWAQGCNSDQEQDQYFNGNIEGKITDAATGQPVADAYIQTEPSWNEYATAEEYFLMNYDYFDYASDDSGHYLIRNVPEGLMYFVAITKWPGYNQKVIRIESEGKKTVRVDVSLDSADAESSVAPLSLEFAGDQEKATVTIGNPGTTPFYWECVYEDWSWFQADPELGIVNPFSSTLVSVYVYRENIPEFPAESFITINFPSTGETRVVHIDVAAGQ
jgi:hypothetical protein